MDISDDFYKKQFKEQYTNYFRKKPTRNEVISFMWGMSAGEDRHEKLEAIDDG